MSSSITIPANEILTGDITTDPMFGNRVEVLKVTITEKSVHLLVRDLKYGNGNEYGFSRRLTTKTKVSR